MNPRLAGVMTLFMPVALVITIIFAKFARERFREIRTKLAKINSYLSENPCRYFDPADLQQTGRMQGDF